MKKRSYLRSFLFTFAISLVAMFLSSFMLVNGMSLSESGFVQGLLQLFSILIFGAFFYSILWTEGERDRNIVDVGRMKQDLWRGAKIGALVMVPYMLTSILLVLAKVGVFGYGDFIYRVLNSHLIVMVNAVIPFRDTDFISTTGMNLIAQLVGGVRDSQIQWWQIVVVTLYHLLIPIICGVSYVFGYHRIDITHGLVYRGKKKAKKD